jgi:RNA polymerase sigma-70 factor (ECF subfamily)
MAASDIDAALVWKVRRGDAKAFEALVRRHLSAAQAVAASTVGNPIDVDDVCQDAFITALQRIQQCRHPDRFRAWLLTIVRNRAHNLREHRAVRSAEPLDSAYGVSSSSDPQRDAERSEIRGDLGVALEGLTEYQRRVISLHDLEGWTHGEIGQELGISAGASRFHLFAARKALRAKLAPRYGGEI